ncbi:hypothetical protein GMRT_24231 [Giardia muris]|uniref:High cysteine membrane protein n=1 Tax=Giardia muris TaxID=5742 RepID=A0A4Z1T3U8_GIAMU|nr:hypothetical protein GMRT_24217 [Giardia muris]TNJ27215.1 hypothetical protein GMRT_24231 [Giardia muris]|eukprot:TNJ27209.1 hypothetical protein GMRT_24217 [Giardia muris]
MLASFCFLAFVGALGVSGTNGKSCKRNDCSGYREEHESGHITDDDTHGPEDTELNSTQLTLYILLGVSLAVTVIVTIVGIVTCVRQRRAVKCDSCKAAAAAAKAKKKEGKGTEKRRLLAEDSNIEEV